MASSHQSSIFNLSAENVIFMSVIRHERTERNSLRGREELFLPDTPIPLIIIEGSYPIPKRP